jgi:hypothetical protein
MLLTVTNSGSSAPDARRPREVALVVLHRATSSSRGSCRKRSSKRPASGTGHSTSAVTSSSSVVGSTSARRRAVRQRPRHRRGCARRSAKSRSRGPLLEHAHRPAAAASRIARRWKRWPRVTPRPAGTPSIVAGQHLAPYSITSQCTGARTARPAPQRMRFGIGSPRALRRTMPAAGSRRAARLHAAPRDRKLPLDRSRAPALRRDAAALGEALRGRVARRSASKAAAPAGRGATTCGPVPVRRGAATSTARRRGVANACIGAVGEAGAARRVAHREAQRLAAVVVGLGDGARQRCARAGCSAGARSPRWRGAHPAG